MMWAWLRSPRGSTLTATAVAALLALFWLAPWSRPLPHVPGLSLTGGEVATLPPAAAPAPSPSASAASPALPGSPSSRAGQAAAALANAAAPVAATPVAAVPVTSVGAMPATATRVAATPAALASASPAAVVPPAKLVPSFDVVRVEPSGATIIAGRAEPGSDVTLLDNGKALAHATVGVGGQFALLPPDLGEGSHYLTLQAGSGAGVVSTQGVAVSVPKAGATSRPMVAMLSPDQPVKVLSDGASLGAPAGVGASSGPEPVAIQAVEASRGGKFTATGTAKAGSQSRLYLNGAFLADVTADKDGRWAVRVEQGMRPGRYVVRADQLEGENGKVSHRAEVPFTYPATLGKGLGKQLLMAHGKPAVPGATPSTAVANAAQDVATLSGAVPSGPSPAPTVIQDLKLTTVIRGDSLWRISRKLLGRGIDYTEIYASNTNQIRDPKLIYPGQIFVLPQGPAK